MHGQGTLTYKNQSKYEGEFVKDEREGKGTFTWVDGHTYIGTWKADK